VTLKRDDENKGNPEGGRRGHGDAESVAEGPRGFGWEDTHVEQDNGNFGAGGDDDVKQLMQVYKLG
jgi:hypothetical protein